MRRLKYTNDSQILIIAHNTPFAESWWRVG